MLRRAAPLALLALLLPATALAQNEYEQFVMDLASEFGQIFEDEGFLDTGQGIVSSLGQDASEVHYFNLPAGGSYVLFGVCDADCSDMDLILYDPSGNEVERDWEADDSPIVGVDSSVGGSYRVEVGMPTCSSEPCYYSVSVYRGTGESAYATGDEYVDQVLGFLSAAGDALVTQGYSQLGEPVVSSLDSGASEDQYVSLLAGRDHQLVAVCDVDCSDIDLTVYDPSGSQVAEDILTDDVPVLEVPAARGGRYRVNVHMYECSSEPCYYALGTYARGGKGGKRKGGAEPQPVSRER